MPAPRHRESLPMAAFVAISSLRPALNASADQLRRNGCASDETDTWQQSCTLNGQADVSIRSGASKHSVFDRGCPPGHWRSAWAAVRPGPGRRPNVSGWIRGELASDSLTYAYITVSTVAAFTIFGRVLGRLGDRLEAQAQTDALTGLLNRRGVEAQLRAGGGACLPPRRSTLIPADRRRSLQADQ